MAEPKVPQISFHLRAVFDSKISAADLRILAAFAAAKDLKAWLKPSDAAAPLAIFTKLNADTSALKLFRQGYLEWDGAGRYRLRETPPNPRELMAALQKMNKRAAKEAKDAGEDDEFNEYMNAPLRSGQSE